MKTAPFKKRAPAGCKKRPAGTACSLSVTLVGDSFTFGHVGSGSFTFGHVGTGRRRRAGGGITLGAGALARADSVTFGHVGSDLFTFGHVGSDSFTFGHVGAGRARERRGAEGGVTLGAGAGGASAARAERGAGTGGARGCQASPQGVPGGG
eukprot:1628759-Pyramimonas_sp.AAC.1